MDVTELRMHRGDARTLIVPLELDGVSWPVPDGADVRMTAKRDRRDSDELAVFAHSNAPDGGITVDGNVVRVQIVPADTEALTVDTGLQCDVQVTVPGDPGPVTVTDFVLSVRCDVTRHGGGG